MWIWAKLSEFLMLWPGAAIEQHRPMSTLIHLGRLICPEGRVSSLNKSNPTNIDSDNGLVPNGTKQLHEPVLTPHECGSVPFEQFYTCSRYQSITWVWKLQLINLLPHALGANGLTHLVLKAEHSEQLVWGRKDPGHQQPWHWQVVLEIMTYVA